LIFGRKAVLTLTGLTGRQMDYWATTGVVRPSVRPAAGKGSRREYSFQDLVALKVAKRLKDEGIALQKIRKTLAWLRKNFPELSPPLTELRLVTDGVSLFVLDRDPAKFLDVLRGRQFVFSLALGEIIQELQGELKRFASPRQERVMVGDRLVTVVLTPDPEAGGFTAQCHQEPWALSRGETEQEALDHIIEALELGPEHEGSGESNAASNHQGH
jgi:DNA-binding transcriptional MerR regulator